MANEILICNLDFHGLGMHRSKERICFLDAGGVERILFPPILSYTHFFKSSALRCAHLYADQRGAGEKGYPHFHE